jgi:hypothetical protein
MRAACYLGVALMLVCASGAPVAKVSDVVPETAMLDKDDKHKEDPVVKSILEVKAWCMLSHAKHSADLDAVNHKKGNAIVDMMGKMSKTPKSGNIVTQFGEIIGEMKAHEDFGMPGYILTAINKAVLDGKSVFKNVKHKIVLDPEVIGFADMPDYFMKFSVPSHDWIHETSELNRGDAAKAVKTWVTQGEAAAYKHNVEVQLKELHDEREAETQKRTAAAHKAIVAAFTESGKGLTHKSDVATKIGVVKPLSGEGYQGGKRQADTSTYVEKSDEEIEKEAHTKAQEDIKTESQKASIATIVREVEEAAMAEHKGSKGWDADGKTHQE